MLTNAKSKLTNGRVKVDLLLTDAGNGALRVKNLKSIMGNVKLKTDLLLIDAYLAQFELRYGLFEFDFERMEAGKQ